MNRFENARNFQNGNKVRYMNAAAKVQKYERDGTYEIIFRNRATGRPTSRKVRPSELNSLNSYAVNSNGELRIDPVTLEPYPLRRQIKLGNSYHDVNSVLSQIAGGYLQHPLRRTPFTMKELVEIRNKMMGGGGTPNRSAIRTIDWEIMQRFKVSLPPRLRLRPNSTSSRQAPSYRPAGMPPYPLY